MFTEDRLVVFELSSNPKLDSINLSSKSPNSKRLKLKYPKTRFGSTRSHYIHSGLYPSFRANSPKS